MKSLLNLPILAANLILIAPQPLWSKVTRGTIDDADSQIHYSYDDTTHGLSYDLSGLSNFRLIFSGTTVSEASCAQIERAVEISRGQMALRGYQVKDIPVEVQFLKPFGPTSPLTAAVVEDLKKGGVPVGQPTFEASYYMGEREYRFEWQANALSARAGYGVQNAIEDFITRSIELADVRRDPKTGGGAQIKSPYSIWLCDLLSRKLAITVKWKPLVTTRRILSSPFSLTQLQRIHQGLLRTARLHGGASTLSEDSSDLKVALAAGALVKEVLRENSDFELFQGRDTFLKILRSMYSWQTWLPLELSNSDLLDLEERLRIVKVETQTSPEREDIFKTEVRGHE